MVDKEEKTSNNPTILATTPKTSFVAESTQHTTVKSVSLVDFGQKHPVEVPTAGIPGTRQGGGSLTKSPQSLFANTRFPGGQNPPPVLPDFKSPQPTGQRPLPFSPPAFSIKQASKQKPFQARPTPQLPQNSFGPQVPSANRFPKVSPLFQDPNPRNPGIKSPGFQDPGSLVPGFESSVSNTPGVLGPVNQPVFPGKQSAPFRPSPALAGVSDG